MTEAVELFTPAIQYGFAGFSFFLLCILVWLVRRLLDVLDSNNRVIVSNTDAIRACNDAVMHELQAVDEHITAQQTMLASLRDRLLLRPCIRERE